MTDMDADYVVLRPSPDMPAEWMPDHLDGKSDGAVAEVWEVMTWPNR